MGTRISDLIMTVIECVEPPLNPVPGQPPMPAMRVLAALRQFRREGTPGTASPCLPPAGRFATAQLARQRGPGEQLRAAPCRPNR